MNDQNEWMNGTTICCEIHRRHIWIICYVGYCCHVIYNDLYFQYITISLWFHHICLTYKKSGALTCWCFLFTYAHDVIWLNFIQVSFDCLNFWQNLFYFIEHEVPLRLLLRRVLPSIKIKKKIFGTSHASHHVTLYKSVWISL